MKINIGLVAILMALSHLGFARIVVSDSPATWINHEPSRAVFSMSAQNLVMAKEVTSFPDNNSSLGTQLSFNPRQSPEGVCRAFSINTRQIDAGFTFNDEEGSDKLSNFKNAISIGDVNNYEDDDFEIIFDQPVYFFGFDLVENSIEEGELIKVYGMDGTLLETIDSSHPMFPNGDAPDFIGFESTTSEAIGSIKFFEASGGDDIALGNLYFRDGDQEVFRGDNSIPCNQKYLNEPFDISAGANHACAVDNKGLLCWGNNDQGQLSAPSSISKISQLAAGANYNCAIDEQGLVCWGKQELKKNTTNYRFLAGDSILKDAGELVIGSEVACAVSKDRSSNTCWGDVPLVKVGEQRVCRSWSRHVVSKGNERLRIVTFGHHGNRVENPMTCDLWVDEPIYALPGSGTITDISAGVNSLCYIRGGKLTCTGYLTLYGDAPNLANPQKVALSEGSEFACAIAGGDVHCWGDEGRFPGIFSIPDLTNPSAIALGSSHACVIDNNQVACWGDIIENPTGITNPTKIVSGIGFTCALADEGVVCFGREFLGEGTPLTLNDSDGDGLFDYQEIQYGTLINNPHSDGDGMDDGYEVQFGFDPLVDDGSGDADGDGVENGVEYTQGSNPKDVDSDGDGFDDLFELTLGWDLNNDEGKKQLDNDGDGLTNFFEYSVTQTDINSIDSDNDGLSDVAEIEMGTNPNKADSDNDGLPDNLDRYPMTEKYQIISNPRYAGDSIGCLIDDSGVSCWPNHDNNISFNQPYQISLDLNICVLDVDGVNCWHHLMRGEPLPSPELINPRFVSAGSNSNCAIDDTGVVCWNNDGSLLEGVPKDFINPRKIVTYDSFHCVLDVYSVKCFGEHYGYITNPNRDGKYYGDISLNKESICATINNDVECWGWGYYQNVEPNKFTNVSQVTVGKNYNCALEAGSLSCWELPFGYAQPLSVNNVQYFSLGLRNLCAIYKPADELAAKCWRSYDGQTDTSFQNFFSDKTLTFVDLDSDGLTASEEEALGTSALNPDSDDDTVIDGLDDFPMDPLEQFDTDKDGIGNNADDDDDNDGYLDIDDALPLNDKEHLDFDLDGIGNNADEDDDNDGMSDVYELLHDLNPLNNSDAEIDSDGDQLTNLVESQLMSNPNLVDSDSDQLNDYDEVQLGTNINHQDTDGDGILDGVEINVGSDPFDDDTDDDGLPDLWEHTYEMPINDASNRYSDLDQDGLNNFMEFELNSNPSLKDSDGDLLLDRHEYQLNTNINNPDSDGDGLSDGKDRLPWVPRYHVSSGYGQSCVLDDAGVKCWGYNEEGQTQPPVLNNPLQVASGEDFSCAIDAIGQINRVSCWGIDDEGNTTPPPLNDPTQISLGRKHACVIDSGDVQCWGNNEHGQIDAPLTDRPSSIVLGDEHSCVIDANGVKCWGNIVKVPDNIVNPRQLKSGDDTACVVRDPQHFSESPYLCWGADRFNAYYVQKLQYVENPLIAAPSTYKTCFMTNEQLTCKGLTSEIITIDGLENPKQLAIKGTSNCLIDDNGLQCWGNQSDYPQVSFSQDFDGDGILNHLDLYPDDGWQWADFDQDGLGDYRDDDSDNDGLNNQLEALLGSNQLSVDSDGDGLADNDEFSANSDPTINQYQLATGYEAICLSDQNGFRCWGENTYGQTSPDLAIRHPKDLDMHGRNACALENDQAYCWGFNESLKEEPALVAPTALAMNRNIACVIDEGQIVCWGDTTNHNQTVIDLNARIVNPSQIAIAGFSSICVIDDYGLQCERGSGSFDNEPPVLEKPYVLKGGYSDFCAIDIYGLQCWGSFSEDYTDDFTSLDQPFAVSVGDGGSACAIDKNGVHCWGDDDELLNVPQQIVSPSSIDVGGTNVCALGGDQVFCWGGNYSEQITNMPNYLFDADQDGMSNFFERQFGFDVFNGDGSADFDNDGISNFVEFQQQSDPTIDDTDGDGINDGDEVNLYGTSVLLSDSDQDGLDDAQELQLGSSPTIVDSDEDGLGDGFEFLYGFNVLKDEFETHIDSDGEGLLNLAEYHARANPLLIDTDDDGLNDLQEVNRFLKPYDDDFDLDGLVDGIDINPFNALYEIYIKYGVGCALDDNGVQCWADDDYSNADFVNPRSMVLGHYWGCVLTDVDGAMHDGGQLSCWGEDPIAYDGEPGLFDAPIHPITNNPINSFINIIAKDDAICGIYLTNDNKESDAICWGNANLVLPDFENPLKLEYRSDQACVIERKNGLVCFGDNTYLQLAWPKELDLTKVKDVALSDDHSCLLTGQIGYEGVWCVGSNYYGKAKVPELSNPYAIDVGYDFSCALDDTGLVCWGDIESVPQGFDGAKSLTASDSSICVKHESGFSCGGYDDSGETSVPQTLVFNDRDGDGLSDDLELQLGTNIDHPDSDLDGSFDGQDAFPLNPSEQLDSDGDGVGDHSDATPFPVAGTFNFTITDFVKSETDGEMVITINRSKGAFGKVDLQLNLLGSAIVDQHFNIEKTQLTFLDGEEHQEISLTLLDDDVYFGDRNLIVEITSDTPDVLIGDNASLRLTILEDDQMPISDVVTLDSQMIEVNEDAGQVELTLTRVGNNNSTLQIAIESNPITATKDVDYELITKTLLFDQSNQSQKLLINILNDDVEELAESVELIFTDVDSMLSETMENAVIQINDDDRIVDDISFVTSRYELEEGSFGVNINVMRVGDNPNPITLDVILTHKSSSDADIVLLSENLTFSESNQTLAITVDVLEDELEETSELAMLSFEHKEIIHKSEINIIDVEKDKNGSFVHWIIFLMMLIGVRRLKRY